LANDPAAEFQRDGFYIFRNVVAPDVIASLRNELTYLNRNTIEQCEYISITQPPNHSGSECQCCPPCQPNETVEELDWRTCKRQYLEARQASVIPSRSTSAAETLLFSMLPECVAKATGWQEEQSHKRRKKTKTPRQQMPTMHLFNEHFVDKPPSGGLQFLWHRDADKHLACAGSDSDEEEVVEEVIPEGDFYSGPPPKGANNYVSTWLTLDCTSTEIGNGTLCVLPASSAGHRDARPGGWGARPCVGGVAANQAAMGATECRACEQLHGSAVAMK
jgi:hypothetical protein